MSAQPPFPLHVYRFQVDFFTDSLSDDDSNTPIAVCSGAFAECTGIEATMEPKVIKEGGRNYGVVQRVGPVTFSTVVLKRGISGITDLYAWFDLVAGGAYAKRLTATISWYGPKINNDSGAPDPILQWRLVRALPTKFKTADFNATASAVGVEELHIAHEGLQQVVP